MRLLDNYDRKTGTDETYSDAKLQEQEHFLQEVMKTDLMNHLYSFFNEKGKVLHLKKHTDFILVLSSGQYPRMY